MAIRCQGLWEHQTNFNRDRCVTQTVKLIYIFLKPFFLHLVGVQQVILPIDAQIWQSQMCCLLQNVLVDRCSPSDKDHHRRYRAGCQLEIYRALIFIGPIIAKISVRLLCTIDATQPCIYLFFFPSRAHNTNAQPLPFPKSILLELYLKGGE